MTAYGIGIRAALYFSIAVLTPVAAVLGESADGGEWPTRMSMVAATVAGVVSGMTALRAFVDSSMQQFKESKETDQP